MEILKPNHHNSGSLSNLNFIFEREPIRALYDGELCTEVIFKNKISAQLEHIKTDLVITCTGYRNRNLHLTTNVPTFKVGWIARNSKGTLADSALDANECLKKIVGAKIIGPREPFNKIPVLKEGISKSHLKKLLFDEKVLSELTGKPLNIPESSLKVRTNNLLQKLLID